MKPIRIFKVNIYNLLKYFSAATKKPDFGAIRGEVPPAKTIYQHTSVDQVVMIVETEAE